MGTARSKPSSRITSIDYANFFRSLFPTDAEAKAFVERVESHHNVRVKRMMHQGARMLWLSDRMAEIAPARPALQILFFLIAAEAVAKLHDDFKEEGKSRHYVRRFFLDLCPEPIRERLARGFVFYRYNPETIVSRREEMSTKDAVDLLYMVRCDVAHEGIFFAFDLAEPESGAGTLTFPPGSVKNSDLDEPVDLLDLYETTLSADELRKLVLGGIVAACQSLLV